MTFRSKTKYANRKVERDGMVFDSVKEYARYCDLCLLQKAGQITDLQRQVKFSLIPSQKADGKVIERAVAYIADFVYWENGKMVVEDVKGMRTKEYILKRKMMLWFHKIRIKEV